jgi:hypothetical protein
MECYSFGGYEVVSNYDWSTLPYEEWASWAWASWKANDGSTGTEFDVCTDSQGYVYRMNDSRLDDGEEYESYIVFETDLAQKGALPFYKRLLKIQFYTRDSGSGTLDVSIKRDLETEWVSAGAVALGGGRDINTTVLPVDFRAKTFKVKVSSTYDFQLVGMVFWFQPMGDR